MKLRVKYIKDIGWYAQVKKHFFSDWKTIGSAPGGYIMDWKTIGIAPGGYILYPEWHDSCPMSSKSVAETKCKSFKKWYLKQKNRTINYYYVK